DDEVAIGSKFIAHIDQLALGWVKFVGGKVAEQRIGRAADGFALPAREELGDTDESQWQIDKGEPRDPWVYQQYLGLENKDGELFNFVTASKGGISAISKLINLYGKNVRNGLPLIRLEVGSYKHKQYGRTEVPEFPVVHWTGATGQMV